MLVIMTLDIEREFYNDVVRMPTDLQKEAIIALLQSRRTYVRDISRASSFCANLKNEGRNEVQNRILRQITGTDEGQEMIREFLNYLRE